MLFVKGLYRRLRALWASPVSASAVLEFAVLLEIGVEAGAGRVVLADLDGVSAGGQCVNRVLVFLCTVSNQASGEFRNKLLIKLMTSSDDNELFALPTELARNLQD